MPGRETQELDPTSVGRLDCDDHSPKPERTQRGRTSHHQVADPEIVAKPTVSRLRNTGQIGTGHVAPHPLGSIERARTPPTRKPRVCGERAR